MSFVVQRLKLFVPANQASINPPLGPMLGQYGLSSANFCEDFNDLTFELEDFLGENYEFYLVVWLSINDDKTFLFIVEKPTISFLLELFSEELELNRINTVFVRSIELLEFVKIAKFKFQRQNLFSACSILRGTTRAMKICVVCNNNVV